MIEKRKITKKIKKYYKNGTIISIMNGGSKGAVPKEKKKLGGLGRSSSLKLPSTSNTSKTLKRSYSLKSPTSPTSPTSPISPISPIRTTKPTIPLTSINPTLKKSINPTLKRSETAEAAKNAEAAKIAEAAKSAAEAAKSAAEAVKSAVLKSLQNSQNKQKALEEAKKQEEQEAEKKKAELEVEISNKRKQVEEQKELLAGFQNDLGGIRSMLATVANEAADNTVSVDKQLSTIAASVPKNVQEIVKSLEFRNLLTSSKVASTASNIEIKNTSKKIKKAQNNIKKTTKSKENAAATFTQQRNSFLAEQRAISEKLKSQGQQQKPTSTIGWFKKTILKSFGFKDMSVANQKFIQGKLNNLNAQFERKEKLLNKKIENLKKKGESNVELLKNLEEQKQKMQKEMTDGLTNIFKEFTGKVSEDVANAEASLKKSADDLGSLESQKTASRFKDLIKSMVSNSTEA
jgi:hypothetical protein